jgi:hypothetical protein
MVPDAPRSALRRDAEELNTTSGPGLEEALARISTEIPEAAAYRHADATREPDHADAAPDPKPTAHQESRMAREIIYLVQAFKSAKAGRLPAPFEEA